ncbi:MAG TPA: BON domain-containing protein [Thermoanaerobaculia bacterium]|nr:BON domain-containing protein [Thermoanaerobaculia bacterium]
MFREDGEEFTRGGRGDREVAQGYRSLEADRGRQQSFRGRGPKNYQRSDERIHEDVCERLTSDHEVDATDIEVQVVESRVMLTGTVSDRRAKRRAEDIAESVTGVKEVENHLRVVRAET